MASSTPPLAALITIFTRPCPATWLLTTTKVPSQYPAFPSAGAASCDPPSWAGNLAGAGFDYYSPAICPSGFSVGPSCAIIKARTAEGFPPVEDGETAIYCVPSGHTCTSDTTDFRGGVWGFARTTAAAGALVTVGPAIQIRFRSADLTLLETHPLTPGLVLAGATDTGPIGGFFTVGVPSSLDVGSGSATGTLRTVRTKKTADTVGVSATGPISSTSTPPQATPTAPHDDGNSRTVVPVAVLASLLFAVISGLAVFFILRRYRRRHAGRLDGLLPVGVGVWLGRAKPVTGQGPPSRGLGSTLAGEGAGPGTGLPPVAELDGVEIGPHRWSWMERVPKQPMRSLRAVFSPGSRVSTHSSRWTRIESEKTFSGTRGMATPTARERWAHGLHAPVAAGGGRQSPARSVWSHATDASISRTDGGRSAQSRLSPFTRLSDGTFGRLGSPFSRELPPTPSPTPPMP